MKYVTIRPGGRFGNHVIMYMAAMAIAERLGGATICGLGFPQWDIPNIPEPDMPVTINILRESQFNLDALAKAVAGADAFHIVISMHMQVAGQFLDVTSYRKAFPLVSRDVPVFDERYLLIHIRTGDLLTALQDGFHWYPLMPVEFYQDLVAETGKLPVFMGELEDCAYVRHLKALFPDAIYIPRQNIMQDFDMIRQAACICVSVSTFSWVAAWLSHAREIYLPLNGFFNPAHMRAIDLLPVDDARYHFYLFPLNCAMSEVESLRVHVKMQGWWRKISSAQLQALRRAPGQVALANATKPDPHWYLGEYLDAAMAISEGKFADPEAHYFHRGRQAGYLPFAPVIKLPQPAFENIAIAKPATQSSISQWSRGGSAEADAAGAVDGNFAKPFGFHTAFEANPWWMVDLTAACLVREIHIYNRAGEYALRARAAPVVLLCSTEGMHWTELLRTAPGTIFGGERGPLCWRGDPLLVTRYVKIIIESPRQALHLAQVAVFGEAR